MARKSLLKDFSYRLRKLRESLNHSHRKMAAYFGTGKTNYTRYENSKIFPNFMGLYYFASNTGISLDWLVCGKGPRYYEEKEKADKEVLEEKEVIEEKGEIQVEPAVKIVDEETRSLLDYMEMIPLFRHEILVYFYRFKEEHKEMVAAAEAAMKDNSSGEKY